MIEKGNLKMGAVTQAVVSLVGVAIGGMVTLSAIYVSDYLKQKREQNEERILMEEWLEGQRFYLRSVVYAAVEASIRAQFYGYLISTNRKIRASLSHDSLKWYEKENDYWRGLADTNRPEEIQAIRAFSETLIRIQHLYSGNKAVLDLCKRLLVAELPLTEGVEEDPDTISAFEKWRDANFAYLYVYWTEEWDDPVEKLIKLVHQENESIKMVSKSPMSIAASPRKT